MMTLIYLQDKRDQNCVDSKESTNDWPDEVTDIEGVDSRNDGEDVEDKTNHSNKWQQVRRPPL